MSYNTLFESDSVEVSQTDSGTISFSYSNATDAMFDLYERIVELDNALDDKHEDLVSAYDICTSLSEALEHYEDE